MRIYICLFCACCWLGLAASANGDVERVVLFPDGSQVTQAVSAQVENIGSDLWEAVFHLPATANPDSLRFEPLSLESARIQNISHKKVRSQDPARIAELKKELRELKKEQSGITAALTGTKARIDLWHNVVQAVSGAKDPLEMQSLQELSSNLGRTLPSLIQDKYEQETRREEMTSRIKEVEKELQDSIDNPESQLQVRIQITAQGTDLDQTLPVTVSYNMPQSQWHPVYSLEADPDAEEISFQWRAAVIQRSGQIWKDVHLRLSTGRMHQQTILPDLPDWIVQPRPQPGPLAGEQAFRDTSMKRALLSTAAPNKEAAQSEFATYDLWDVGEQTIYPGRQQQVNISQSVWPATFERILRPAVDNRAFLQADISLEAAQNIPAGDALLMVQGRTVGKRRFAFAGRDIQLSFGSDPQVSGRRILERKQEGEEGLLKNKQKLTWEYRFDLENGKDEPIKIRLEESRPVSRHEDIGIEVASPGYEPYIQDNSLVWELELKPGEKKAIPFHVVITAPKDMDVSSSR
jgi:uncharacterized protein (TIGR02231 family)